MSVKGLSMFRKSLYLLSIFSIVLLSIPASGLSKELSTSPKTKDNGGKFRVAFIQGGSYFEYDQVFLALLRELGKIGWLDVTKLPKSNNQSAQQIFKAASSTKDISNYLEFVPDAFYDSAWKDDLRLANKNRLIERQKKKDIDLILAFGTWAGQDMKNMPPGFDIPAVVMDVSDALKAEIVDSNTDSGRDNLTARVDPSRFLRQVTLFHEIFGFNKLGMAFEDTVEGRSYAAIEDVETVASELGFTVEKELHPGYMKSKEQSEAWMLDAIKRLAPKIDAFYITGQLAIDQNSLPKYLEILNANDIPTFSQTGTSEVENGALLSIATSGFKYVAEFHARKIAQILNGAKPRSLPLLFEDPSKIAINLKTCMEIGFDPPVDILGAADEIFSE
ncbi:MAG: ABC transporter substrate-binding protein [Desulfuromonas sp.]|nr:MAG: ABC transporter substrate-binding protein [Desulfuromonas sp.]